MKKSILYIFDEHSDVKKLLGSIRGVSARVLIVPLSVDEKKTYQVEEILRPIEFIEVIRIPFVISFNKKAFEVRDDFIKFIADFPRRNMDNKNLKEYFKYPFRNFSVWWFSLIAEKNTLKSGSFHSLVKLLTVEGLCREYGCEEIWLDISDNNLAGTIKDNAGILGISCDDFNRHKEISEYVSIFKAVVLALKYFLVLFSRSIFAGWYMPGLMKRKRNLGKCKYLLVTYFPNLDELELKKGRFINKYYEPLQKALEQRYEGYFAWLAMTSSSSRYSWRENLNLGRRINECGNQFMFCEEWAGPIDWLKIITVYIAISVKWFFCMRHLSKNFRYSKTKLNIWQLFRKDWHDSFCGYALMEGIFYYTIFSNAFNHLDKGAKVTYFAEMHCWEKALNIASRRYKNIKTFGIQHTIVPLLLLMYFNDRSELENGDYVRTVPRPDYLACVGEITAKLFRDSGWNKDAVFVWGALRFRNFKHHLDHILSWEKRKNRVIIALSIMPEESGEMLLYAYQALKDITGCEVFIKSHPHLLIDKLVNSLGINFNAANFTICNLPLEMLLPNAKAVIVTESSAALEAIACGTPVIIPRLVNIVDMNPMSGFSDLPIYVDDSRQMRCAVEQILSKKEPPFSAGQCKDFIRRYCSLLDSEDDFLRKLEAMN